MSDFYRGLAEIAAPEHTAVLVIDMQRDFCDPAARFAGKGVNFEPVQTMMPVFRDFIARARARGLSIISARMTQADVYASGPLRELNARHNTGPYACTEGTPGTDYMPDFEPEPDDLIITKHGYSAFSGTDLETELHRRGIETLVVGGVATNVCVESTCRDGFLREFYIVVAENLVACGSPERQQHSLFNLDRYFGLVTPSREILAAWDG
jgi:ureidoacrylate peracid hydrolase